MASVSLCDLSSGGCCEGPGTLVWHPDCGVSFWAEESSEDSVTSQPCPRTPGLVSSCCPWGAELSQSSLPNRSSTVQVGKRLLPCTDLGRMEAFCPDLESGAWTLAQSSCQHRKPDLPPRHFPAPVPSLEHLAVNEGGPDGGPGLSNPPGTALVINLEPS